MLEKNLSAVFDKIKDGNNFGEPITLVAATKTVPVDTINEAIRLGVKIVGDNKVQEFTEKSPFIKGADFHFIGHLQTNKVKYLVGKVSLIHSVDSLHLAKEISARSVKLGVTTEILLEVNIGNEITKSGLNYDDVLGVAEEVNKLNGIKLVGLMAMLPHTDDLTVLENLCFKMRNLYDIMKKDGYAFKYLSMGMSNDYETAIKCGSNMIRLGSVIFGKRNYDLGVKNNGAI